MHDGDHKSEHQQVDVGFQECLKICKLDLNYFRDLCNLFNTVLILVIFLLSHEVPKNIEPVPELLGGVHLPLEHGQGLDGQGNVHHRCGGVDGLVVPVEVPVVIEPEDGLVLLE